MSVKVAVRVRPYNQREKDRNSKCCIKMAGPTTCIVDPASGKDKTYTFDYSFWSHDEFETNADGIYVPTGPKYADQQQVYKALGE